MVTALLVLEIYRIVCSTVRILNVIRWILPEIKVVESKTLAGISNKKSPFPKESNFYQQHANSQTQTIE